MPGAPFGASAPVAVPPVRVMGGGMARMMVGVVGGIVAVSGAGIYAGLRGRSGGGSYTSPSQGRVADSVTRTFVTALAQSNNASELCEIGRAHV
jgi:hypothetical protein